MILSLLFAPLNEFFERVPLGRIYNRLSKDLSVIDLDVAFSVGMSILSFFLFILDVF